MADKTIRDMLRDFVSFDIVNNYYKKEEKDELARIFKKILYEDDSIVRKFLQKFFAQTKKLADEYGLIAKEQEAVSDEDQSEEEEENVEEEPDEEPIEAVEGEEESKEETAENEEIEEPEEEIKKNESMWDRYTERATDFLY